MLSLETELFMVRLAFGVTKWRLLIRWFPRPSMATDRAGQSALSGRKRMAGLHRAFGPLFCSNQLAMYFDSATHKNVVGS
jgi:hypothetical protein